MQSLTLNVLHVSNKEKKSYHYYPHKIAYVNDYVSYILVWKWKFRLYLGKYSDEKQWNSKKLEFSTSLNLNMFSHNIVFNDFF